jgi:hypothetical protein
MTSRIIVVHEDGTTRDITSRVHGVLDDMWYEWAEYMDDWQVDFIRDMKVELGIETPDGLAGFRDQQHALALVLDDGRTKNARAVAAREARRKQLADSTMADLQRVAQNWLDGLNGQGV